MFEWLTRVKIYETINLDKKNQLEEALRENKIEFSIDKEDLHHRNAFDAADIGHIIGKPKIVYVFWTTRKYKDQAKLIVNLIK